jgi:hypothetical protein
VLACLREHFLLGLFLQFSHGVELSEEDRGESPRFGGQPRQPLVPLLGSIDRLPIGRYPAGPIGTLDPVLYADRIACNHGVGTAEFAKQFELSEPFVDPSPDRSDAQPFGQGKGISLVVLGPPALIDTGDHDLLDVRIEDLVEPSRMSAFLQAKMPRLWEGLEESNQCSRIGLENLGLQTTATGTDNGSRAT